MSPQRPLEGQRYLIFVEHEYEDLELWYPKLRLEEAGAHVVVAGPKLGETYRGKHGYPCVADGDIPEMEDRRLSRRRLSRRLGAGQAPPG